MNLKTIKEVVARLRGHKYEVTPTGLLMPAMGASIGGVYSGSVNEGPDEVLGHNLVPAAAILSILDTYLGSTAKQSTWHLALYSGQINPASNWTAANFASTASEITSNTEGYSETTRPTWTPAAAAAGEKSNSASKARFTFATSSSVVVEGGALLSNSTKGGTTGVLVSAGRFTAAKTFADGETFDLAYTVKLQDV